MATNVLERFKSAVSVFMDPSKNSVRPEYATSNAPSTRRMSFNTQGSVAAKIYNQISIDASSTSIRHVRLGSNGRYEDDIQDYLNSCLTFRPNIDQTARSFFQDVVWTMIEEGHAAVVPVDTTASIYTSSGFDTRSMRVGHIVSWYPRFVTVEIYNDRAGRKVQITVPKENVAIMSNPLYEVMNKPSSDLRRLVDKLNLLDRLDKQNASGKLDLIIQLPYEVRNDMRRQQARDRRKDIEDQLSDSQLGIAYIGSTERVTQLNRAATNNLLEQIEYLTKQVYNALGMTEDVFTGKADSQTTLNYYNRTINPILDEIVSALSWGFLSQTARSQGQAIRWFRSPFALVPMDKFPEIATQLSSSEIATSNEIRAELGWKPSSEPNADQLRNPNVNPVDSAGSEVDESLDEADEESATPAGSVPVSELLNGVQNGI